MASRFGFAGKHDDRSLWQNVVIPAQSPRQKTADLIDWYLKNRRNYPWRENQTPYRVWISEIMLQQTVVQAVVSHFNNWMTRWASVGELAQASQDEVMREWEGLGYYSRARNIHSSAKIIVERHCGELPADLKSLRSLPGIGEYTAGAILSIAFNQPQPAIDANVKRIFQRWHCWRRWSKENQIATNEEILKMMSVESPRRITEALMQLGQIVCLARSPKCEDCPVVKYCLANKEGVQEEIPAVKSKVITKLNSFLALVVWEGKLLIRQQPDGVMKGLWVMPRFPVDGQDDDVSDRLAQMIGANVRAGVKLTVRTHHYTRFAERLFPVVFTVDDDGLTAPSGWAWVRLSDLADLAFASLYRKVVDEWMAADLK